MARRPIKIHRYNSSWSIQYEKYKDAIEEQLGNIILQIEHIGSTSVEGLGAKPIIDIVIGVADIEAPEIVEGMENVGFRYLDKYEDIMPFRRYFVDFEGDEHKAHVHVVPENHKFLEDHIYFRDYLREHPDVRDEYHLLKTRLAGKHKEDRESYQEGKSKFIREVTKKAHDYYDAV